MRAFELEQRVAASKSTFYFVNLADVRSVVGNLKFVYHSVIASEHLLESAICMLRSRPRDGYGAELLTYYEEHLEEERSHAKWLAEDLSTHGVSLSGFDEYAAAVVGVQYYMLFHRHPASLLGYLAVTEGVPTPISEVEKAERIYGKKLFRFCRFHANKDKEHRVDVFRMVDKTPAQLIDDVFTSADVTLSHMRRAANCWYPASVELKSVSSAEVHHRG